MRPKQENQRNDSEIMPEGDLMDVTQDEDFESDNMSIDESSGSHSGQQMDSSKGKDLRVEEPAVASLLDQNLGSSRAMICGIAEYKKRASSEGPDCGHSRAPGPELPIKKGKYESEEVKEYKGEDETVEYLTRSGRKVKALVNITAIFEEDEDSLDENSSDENESLPVANAKVFSHYEEEDTSDEEKEDTDEDDAKQPILSNEGVLSPDGHSATFLSQVADFIDDTEADAFQEILKFREKSEDEKKHFKPGKVKNGLVDLSSVVKTKTREDGTEEIFDDYLFPPRHVTKGEVVQITSVCKAVCDGVHATWVKYYPYKRNGELRTHHRSSSRALVMEVGGQGIPKYCATKAEKKRIMDSWDERAPIKDNETGKLLHYEKEIKQFIPVGHKMEFNGMFLEFVRPAAIGGRLLWKSQFGKSDQRSLLAWKQSRIYEYNVGVKKGWHKPIEVEVRESDGKMYESYADVQDWVGVGDTINITGIDWTFKVNGVAYHGRGISYSCPELFEEDQTACLRTWATTFKYLKRPTIKSIVNLPIPPWMSPAAKESILHGRSALDGNGYIYVLSTDTVDGSFKIGCSINVIARVTDLQRRNKEDYNIRYRKFSKFRYLCESMVHAQFQDKRQVRKDIKKGRTEWFQETLKNIMDTIDLAIVEVDRRF